MTAIRDSACDALSSDADQAARQLYRCHGDALHSYVAQFCPDWATAEDIVQEIFIRAWRHLPQLSADDRPLRPWLFRVARNLLIDADRAARARPVTVQAEAAGEIADETGLDQILDRQLLTSALKQLSPDHRAVLVETVYRGRTAVAVARQLGIPRRHGPVTPPLRASRPPPAPARPRRDRRLMTPHPPGSVPSADAHGQAVSGAKIRPARRLITVMLLAAATLDLARCGIVLATATDAVPAAGLVMAGASAAMLSLWTARGCHSGRRWSAWAALLIGLASAPQAATTGFRLPYTLPDTATAALGVLLAVTVLATAETPDTNDDSAAGLIRCSTSGPRMGLPHSDAPDRRGTNR